jgi:Flp pilus assembly protein TadG
MPGSLRRTERGSAVVDFVLVMVILVPLFLGILQVALVLHVRNTLTAAAAEGARYGATIDHTPDNGAARTRQQISDTLSGRFARDVNARLETVDGTQMVVVTVEADVPPLGLWGPALHIEVAGHAIQETTDR